MADRAELKRPRGRPPADPSGTGKRVTVSLNPTEIAYLETCYGSAYNGLRELVRKELRGKAKAQR